MSPAAERHHRHATHMSTLIAAVTDWSVPTPVPGWEAHDVVEHLLDWLPHVVSAWTALQLTTTDADLQTRWLQRSEQVQQILTDPTTAEIPVSDGPFAGQPLDGVIDSIYTSDIYMHSWDLARATNQSTSYDEPFAAQLLAGMQGIDEMLRQSGQYGPKLPTDSPLATDQLAAFIGRDPQWQTHP